MKNKNVAPRGPMNLAVISNKSLNKHILNSKADKDSGVVILNKSK